MLVDTDVLIWCLRGEQKARTALQNLGSYYISSVAYMEILQGIKYTNELKILKQFLHQKNIRHIYLDPEITARAIHWMEEYTLSHSLKMADALVAATADRHGLTLFTGNFNDYKFLPGLKIQRFKL
ncbi:MAG: type II toxin-antitoxin system VapC family toxin [Candidatus Omnitrophota bacterium]